MNSTTRTYISMPSINNLNHLNPFHNISKPPPLHPTLWNFIQKIYKKHPLFNPYGTKPTPIIPSQAIIKHPTQTKLNHQQQQLEGINTLPEKKEDRMLELIQYMSQNQIDIFGLAETNLHWNNGEIYKTQK